MNPIFASDFPSLLADFGQPVVWGALTTIGILCVATEDLVSEDGFAIIRGETHSLQYFAISLPGLKRREVLTVGAASFRVRHVVLEGDGLHAIAYMEPA